MKNLLFILALLLPLPLAAQVALVGHVAAANQSAGFTTAAISTTGANFYAVCVTTNYAGLGANPVDSLGNSYTLVAGGRESNDIGSYLLVSLNPTTGGSVTWSNSSDGNVVALNVMAFSGVASGPDQKNTNNVIPSGTTFSTGSVTPVNANELVLGCVGATGGASTATVNSPMMLVDATSYTQLFGASAYEVQTTATTVNPTFNNFNAFPEVAGVTASF